MKRMAAVCSLYPFLTVPKLSVFRRILDLALEAEPPAFSDLLGLHVVGVVILVGLCGLCVHG